MADKRDLKVRRKAVEKAKASEEQARIEREEAEARLKAEKKAQREAEDKRRREEKAEKQRRDAEKKQAAAEKAAAKAEKAAAQAERSHASPMAPRSERVIKVEQMEQQDDNVIEMPAPPKKRRRGHNTRRTVVRLLVIAALIAGIVLVWKNWDVIAPDELLIWVDEQFHGGSRGDGYPVEVSGESVSAVKPISGQTVLLSDTALEMYDTRGGLSVSRAHTFAQPALKTEGKYALLMETGGKRARLESRARTELDITVDNNLVTGAVSKNGDMALVTDSSESYASAVTVYDKEGKKKYQWFSAEWIVTDVAFSSDSNQMAITGVSAQNGAMVSVLMTFNLRNAKEEPLRQTVAGNMLCAVHYLSGGTVAAVGDHVVWVLKPGGTLNSQQAFDDRELIGYAFRDNAVVVVTRSYGSQQSGSLLCLKASGEVAYQQEFEGVYRHICAAQSGFLMLTDNRLLSTNDRGFEKERAVSGDGRMVSTLDNHMLVLGLATLDEYTWNE